MTSSRWFPHVSMIVGFTFSPPSTSLRSLGTWAGDKIDTVLEVMAIDLLHVDGSGGVERDVGLASEAKATPGV